MPPPDEIQPRPHFINRVPRERLPGIQPLLFRELDQRISLPCLEREPLPPEFLFGDGAEGEGRLVFEGKRYDLNLNVFGRRQCPHGIKHGDGVFVISNGAGVATNTVDQIARLRPVAGMIDLKRNFSSNKIQAAMRMALTVRPELDAVVVNMISGTARAPAVAEAIEAFIECRKGEVPVVVRFNGPDLDTEGHTLLALTETHPCVHLASSTADLVRKVEGLFGEVAPRSPAVQDFVTPVEHALATRAELGVTVDPQVWLTPELTLARVFGATADARIGVLGYGRTARTQVRAMMAQGVSVVWVVTPTVEGHRHDKPAGVEIYRTVAEAVAADGDVDIVVNFAPAARVPDATADCIAGSPNMRLMMLVAENMAYDQVIKVMDALDEAGRLYIGPNSPGMMIVEDRDGTAERFQLGNMPSHLFRKPGGMSVVGRSGTVIFDIVEQARAAGIGARLAWAFGGDKYTGLSFLESLVMLEQDPHTRFIVLDGESGGIQEQLAARLIATGIISKPVVAMVVGETLPAGTQYGHVGAVKYTEADDPRVKTERLRYAGVIVVDEPTEVARVILEIERMGWPLAERQRDALWAQILEEGRRAGRRWPSELCGAFELLYGMVGHFRLYQGHAETPDHLHALMVHITGIGVEEFEGLLDTLIFRDAFRSGFERSREYVAEMARGIREIGVKQFGMLVNDVLSVDSFNKALAATPWAAGDIINEADEIGIPEIKSVIAKTMGMRRFRQTFADKPWNTAHAFRSINNMRWWRFVRAYFRYCTHLTGDAQVVKASWLRNPWASVKLVRGYDRVPEGGLERALEDPAARALFVDKSHTDPQGLLELGKRAFRLSQATDKPFYLVYRELVAEGVAPRPTIDGEIERMGQADFDALVNQLLTPEAFARSREKHKASTARALRLVNEYGRGDQSGAQRLIKIFQDNLDTFDTPAFRRAVGRNLWMALDILRAVGRLQPIEVQRIVDYVVTQATFNFAIEEHQWGTSQALHKIDGMGAQYFFDTHRVIEDVTHDRESFREAFKKNPRDAVEIVQVVGRLGADAFADLMSDIATREAFLARMRMGPRNAAHFIKAVAKNGVPSFNEFVDQDFGRPVLNLMLETTGCVLVHTLRRVNIVGVGDFCDELRRWKAEDPAHVLTPRNALRISGQIKERALARRFSNPERRIPVILDEQPAFEVSEAEVRGFYRSYPEWGDVLFKLQGGEPLTAAEQVDVYALISGRKRFQMYMVPVLVNFVPLRKLRAKIKRGEPLIDEIRSLRGVSQGEGHRFDVYFHTLEVLDQLHGRVLSLDFVPDAWHDHVRALLEADIDDVQRRHLLVLTVALHDLGKVSGLGDHVQRGLAVVEPILDRLGVSEPQKLFITSIIRHHRPPKLRRSGEAWDAFTARGGLNLLYESIVDGGRNAYPVETILHYHADILGRQGVETSDSELARREQVTTHLLKRYMESRGLDVS